MVDELQERKLNFLKELTILTQKYNVEIGGCGCCGSPWLLDTEGTLGHYEITIDDPGSEKVEYINNQEN